MPCNTHISLGAILNLHLILEQIHHVGTVWSSLKWIEGLNHVFKQLEILGSSSRLNSYAEICSGDLILLEWADWTRDIFSRQGSKDIFSISLLYHMHTFPGQDQIQSPESVRGDPQRYPDHWINDWIAPIKKILLADKYLLRMWVKESN